LREWGVQWYRAQGILIALAKEKPQLGTKVIGLSTYYLLTFGAIQIKRIKNDTTITPNQSFEIKKPTN
jgi:hypothetical protein